MLRRLILILVILAAAVTAWSYEALEGDYSFGGEAGRRIDLLEKNWLLTAYRDNPEIIQMFVDRRWDGAHNLLPWNGEFPGKLLTGAADCYAITKSKALRRTMLNMAEDYIAAITPDGYGGPFPDHRRLEGWDSWGIYHCGLGLWKWYKLTGDKKLLNASLRLADYLLPFFNDTESDTKLMYRDGQGVETSQAWLQLYCILYRETGKQEYLDTAKVILEDFALPIAGNYYNLALEGRAFAEMPKPRWESLHPIQGLAELYLITGEEKYKTAFCRIWESIMGSDVHNTGGFSTFEQAINTPYIEGQIETCCTIAYNCLTIDYMRLTGDSQAADSMERAYYNAVWGYQHPGGRWFTYNTPMNEMRKSSYHEIGFQAREGAPDTNCCSVNAARGICHLAQWAYMTGEKGELLFNYYGAAKVKSRGFNIRTMSDYPIKNKVTIRLKSASHEEIPVKFRIPIWSKNTSFRIDGRQYEAVPGTYLTVTRKWDREAKIDIVFDFSLWQWTGEYEKEGKVSLYAGPILLAYDERYNNIPKDSPVISPETARRCGTDELTTNYVGGSVLQPLVLYRLESDLGPVFLSDFATAGMAGNFYNSWLKTDTPVRDDIIPPLRTKGRRF